MISAYLHNLTIFDYGIWIIGVFIFVWGWYLILALNSTKIWAHDKNEYEKRCETVFILTQTLPLLGLLGTVLALLVTFKAFDGIEIDPGKITSDFAPALTTTASGIMALILNIVLMHVPLHIRLSSLKKSEHNNELKQMLREYLRTRLSCLKKLEDQENNSHADN